MATRHLTAFLGGPDDPNATDSLHSSAGAAQYGFGGALILGVHLYGWCARPIMEEFGAEWLDSGWASFRIRRPVYPGNEVTIHVDRTSDNQANLVFRNESAGEDSIVGTVGMGESPFLKDLALPTRIDAEPAQEPRIPLTPDIAPIGQDLKPMAVPYFEADARKYCDETQHDTDPPWTGPGARIHPSWLTLRMTPLLRHTYSYSPGIHTASDIQHLGPAMVGQDVIAAGKFIDSIERNRQTYAVIDGLIRAQDGAPIARLRHTTIYKVSPVE